MSLDAFTTALGTEQGRVEQPPTAVFVLGAMTPGRVHDLVPGDHVELAQSADLTGVDLVRVRSTLAARDVPAGLAWALTLRIDGGVQGVVRARAHQTREVTDLAANVSRLTGVHEVAVRLELTVE